MTKANLLAFATLLSTSFKAMFPTKTSVTNDITASKLQAVGEAIQFVNAKEIAINGRIDGLVASLDGKIDARVSQLGTFVGEAATYAALPAQDHLGKDITAGDVAYLSAVDGTHEQGYYRYDGTNYVFMSGDLQSADILGLMKASSLDDTVDDKFVTPKWVKDYNDSQQPTQAEVDNATA